MPCEAQVVGVKSCSIVRGVGGVIGERGQRRRAVGHDGRHLADPKERGIETVLRFVDRPIAVCAPFAPLWLPFRYGCPPALVD